ncbi:hypothetical protein NQ317_005412 [Molorchus minor]|uniref:Tyr recombinase domain-containing protein n=1 Tax=Molorchus minor TaxID=1323400 RepID=A0ABQ9JI12_9CUCU|nr:hypothetical protein NQ317_005412 [Molorchus minor]
MTKFTTGDIGETRERGNPKMKNSIKPFKLETVRNSLFLFFYCKLFEKRPFFDYIIPPPMSPKPGQSELFWARWLRKSTARSTATAGKSKTGRNLAANFREKDMATVEQRDTQTSGLATLPNTLDLYNDFKDDKDSDEESFHLPLLDCDDDLDSNTKEAASNNTGKDTDCQNAETEDDILNKFETTGTPDLDPKIEDKLLDELDEICGNDSEEKCTKQNVTETITSQKRGDEEVIGKSTNIENIPSELDELNPVKEFESQNKEPDEQTLNESCIESSLDTKSPCVTKEKEIKPECEEENDAVTKMHIRKEEINEEGTINSTDTDIIEIQDDGILDNFITIDELNDSKEDIDINNIKNSNDSDSKETVKERDVTTTKVPEEENGKPLQDTEIESTAEDKIVDFPEDETKNEDLHMEVDEPKTEINDTSKVETEDIAEVEQMEVENPDNATAVEIEHNAEAVESQNDTVTVVQDDDKIVDTQHDAKAIDAEGNEQNLKVQSNNQNTESEQNVQVDTSGFQNSSKSESVTIVSETTVPETTVSQSAVPKTTVSESVSETTASETTAAETTISETAASETTAPETTVPETTSEPELMDLDDSDIAEIEEKKCAESSDKVIESENMGVLEITDSDKQLETVDEEVEKSDTVDEEIKQIKTNSCSLEVEQPENSNDFNKNLDCEDLLDISVIRDADEDNASAIAENANDNQTSEKSDNDDQDEGSDKAENELDETDIDQDDTLLATEKEERMDFEDGNSSNLVYQDNTVSGNTSDSETKDDTDLKDSENENSISVLRETNKVNELNSDTDQTDNLRTESIDSDSQTLSLKSQDLSTDIEESASEAILGLVPQKCRVQYALLFERYEKWCHEKKIEDITNEKVLLAYFNELIPYKIANFLKLSNPKQYTGHCFRRSSTSILANAGADLLTVKRDGGWNSNAVAEGYIETSEEYNKKAPIKILGESTSSISQNKLDVCTTVNKKVNVFPIWR